ncbi:1,4-alpha-glucan branching enzyme GlgB [Adhaeribacter aerolatus]|uniref:1,4-alpha-glucan branching enzyme GlgB n=1 Tax=Adhaeribacter aerolatus TaxID=670289 RepID=A0A512B1T4_9BACT|nr:1,4-alpha-glucan branching protein GlgB [Adhaeribacter aerolatus]GEO05925.1 1,4-alpha-glucan branching enzyme GlgB [Adhaeribacter aerolatus]
MERNSENLENPESLGSPGPGPDINPIKKPRGAGRSKKLDEALPLPVPAVEAVPESTPAAGEPPVKKGRVRRKLAEFVSNILEVGSEVPAIPETAPAGEASTGFPSPITDFDIHLLREGRHYNLYNKLGAHLGEYRGVKGTFFAVWAPNAEHVSVIGDFNFWDHNSYPMSPRWDGSGIWETFVPGVGKGTAYKYFIRSKHNHYAVEKADPYAFLAEVPPRTASVVWESRYEWHDQEWMQNRKNKVTGKDKPYSVYEVHLGSWRRVPEEGNRSLTYREIAEQLVGYVSYMGYTHVEFMPVMEHPFYGSWGYQITGFFAPSSRYGTPEDFKYLIDQLHQAGIGVILDWVPSHFPTDQHGLGFFDGTHLYEHADERKGFHPDWKSYIFNFGRNEVKSFLISNALFWLQEFHVDGLRVDAVASMLYLDYSRNAGEWIPNEFGGRENLESIRFLEEFNDAVTAVYPEVITVAEESTAWPMVTQPTQSGGLGFDMKWMMGWMNDTLRYMALEPIHRSYHQGQITFSIHYAFTESFMLPLSHDEVVHGKGSIVNKMPGDEWQKFASVRLLFSYMYAHPGGKLMFMGLEFGQLAEWNHDSSLQWHLVHDVSYHKGVQQTVRELNRLYRQEPALHELAFDPQGFEWIDMNDATNSVISFIRKGKSEKEIILVVCNFTPTVQENYRVGVPLKGNWTEIFNSDALSYRGSGAEYECFTSRPIPYHNRPYSIILDIPPLAVTYYKWKKA